MNETAKQLSQIKSEIAFYECVGYDDLILFTGYITNKIKLVYERSFISDTFFKRFTDEVVFANLAIAEEFVNNLEEIKGKIELKARSVKYHLNFIIDSYMYAVVFNEGHHL
ncbi:MAG: hypothetical protein ACJ748_12080 [Flavisolibacter sp.]